MLEKPKGGLRAILMQASAVRIWEEVRKPYADDFKEASQRSYWSCAPGQSAEDIVWAQSLRASAATGRGQAAAGFLWDGEKYYESFNIEKLRTRALRHHVNKVCVKMHTNLWQGPRILRIGGSFAEEVLYATRGLPAGSKWNDVYVKAYAIEGFDQFIYRNPDVRLE
eukprot:12428667-Karenia_brevis.AAC.1